MSDKKPKNKVEAPKPKAKTKAKPSYRLQVIMILMVIASAVFMPTSAMLAIGMMPTLAASLLDRSRRKSKVVTVGALNFAGCVPFLLQLWYGGHTLEHALELALAPLAIVVMYTAAAVGYFVDWGVTGFVSGLLYQKGLSRQKEIIAQQQDLVKRWGAEVTGDMALDEHGFPLSS